MDENGNVAMIGAVVGILIMLIVCVLVYYSIAGSIDTSGVDTDVNTALGLTGDALANTSYASNATDASLDQAGTFFSIAPIIGVVAVAVVILQYVNKIGG